MKSTYSIALLFGIGLLIAGCSKQETQPPSGANVAARPSSGGGQEGSTALAILGSEVKSKDFVLSFDLTPKPLKSGTATVKLALSRAGKPVDSAKIRIHFAMASMNMGGPQVDLISNGLGSYSGPVELGMAGTYEAHVTVLALGETATAAYSFEVAE